MHYKEQKDTGYKFDWWRTLSVIQWTAVIAFVVVLVLGLTSCKVQSFTQHHENDSIVTYTRHDTMFILQADSAMLNALMHCDSNYNVILDELRTANGERIRLSALVERLQQMSQDNTPQFAFNVDCKEDSLQKRIEWLEQQIRTIEKDVTVQPQPYVPDYNKNCTRGFWILLAILIVLIGQWALRKYIKFKTGGLSSLLGK